MICRRRRGLLELANNYYILAYFESLYQEAILYFHFLSLLTGD